MPRAGGETGSSGKNLETEMRLANQSSLQKFHSNNLGNRVTNKHTFENRYNAVPSFNRIESEMNEIGAASGVGRNNSVNRNLTKKMPNFANDVKD